MAELETKPEISNRQTDMSLNDFLLLDRPPEASSLQSLLDAQRHTIHQQMEELQRIVVTQCRITGTNPLSQEMAAAVMGIKAVGAGKRYGDSLTPKALKCLFNVFSIKDTITKKEAREISALCGATVMQVREFFSGQRSRVRRLVQQSHEATGYQHCVDINNLEQALDDNLKEKVKQPGSAKAVENFCAEINSTMEQSQQCLQADLKEKIYADLCNKTTMEVAETLIDLMQKENSFTGQIQLSQLILQAHQGPVLRWFISKGGLPLLSKWLTQAALEEQTSLLRILLKALVHLPLGSALPRQMSSLLQTVNKLRFYRAQDVAGRARLLLSRWSRFLRNTTGGRLFGSTGPSGAPQLQKRSRDVTVLQVEPDVVKKKVKTGAIDGPGLNSALILSPTESPSAPRPPGETAALRGTSKKRPARSLLLADRGKERRKVRLFEEVGVAVRRAKDADMARSTSVGMVSRPLSADDIQKAKRRAYLLQSFSSSKIRKPSNVLKQTPCSSIGACMFSGVECSSGKEDDFHASSEPIPTIVGSEVSGNHGETVLSVGITLQVRNGDENGIGEESLEGTKVACMQILSERENVSETMAIQISEEKCDSLGTMARDVKDMYKANAIPEPEKVERAAFMSDAESDIIRWRIPPRIVLDPRWSVASGEESTETVAQSIRLNNEQEVIYLAIDSIPSNPGEPLERFSLFDDDTNVPEFFLEAVAEESQEKESPVVVAYQPGQEQAKVIGEETESKPDVSSKVDKEKGVNDMLNRFSGPNITPITEPTETDQIKGSSDTKEEDVNCPPTSNQLIKLEQEKAATIIPRTASKVKTTQSVNDQVENKSTRIEAAKVVSLKNQEPKCGATLDQQSRISRARVDVRSRPSASKDQSRLPSSSAVNSYIKSSQYKHNHPSIAGGGLQKKLDKTSMPSDRAKLAVKDEQENNKQSQALTENERNATQNRLSSSLGEETTRSSHSSKKDCSNLQSPQSKTSPVPSERLANLSEQARLPESRVDKACSRPKGSGVPDQQSIPSGSFDQMKASTSSEKMDKSSKEVNGYGTQVPVGINLTDLSKEACLEMLRVVLQQLASSSGGSGADLELLAVFLKNPDLVYALTSAQTALPSKELTALTEVLKGHNFNTALTSSSNIRIGATAGLNSSETTQKSLGGMDSKLSAVLSAPVPPLLASSIATTQFRPQLLQGSQLATPPQSRPSMAPIDQVTQSRQVQLVPGTPTPSRPQFSQQSLLYAADRGIPQIMEDTAKGGSAGHHQKSIGLLPLPTSSNQGGGFLPTLARTLQTDSCTPKNPGFDQYSNTVLEHVRPPLGSVLPAFIRSTSQASYGGQSSSLVQEIVGFRPVPLQAEAKGQCPAARQGDQGVIFSPSLQQARLDIVHGRSSFSFMTPPNTSARGNLTNQDQGPVGGASRPPDATLRDSRQKSAGLKETHSRSDQLWMPDSRNQPMIPFTGTLRPQNKPSHQGFEQIVRPAPPMRPPLPPGRPPTRPLTPSTRPPATSVPIVPVSREDLRWHYSAGQPDNANHLRPSWKR